MSGDQGTVKTEPGDLPTYKIVLVSGEGVGKSDIVIQFFQKHFVADYDPTIEDSFIAKKEINGQACILDVLDTAGQEQYSAMREQFMRTGDGFLLVFSVTDPSSLEAVVPLYNQILYIKDVKKCPMILVGNNMDSKERKVSSEQGEQMAEKLKVPYIETKATDPPVNVDKVFCDLVELIRSQTSSSNGNVSKSKESLKKKSCAVL